MKRNDVPAYTLTTEQLEQLIITAVNKATIEKVQSSTDEELLSLKEVQAIFKKSRSTIFSWKKQKILTPVYISGSLFFRRSDITNIINQTFKTK